MQRKTLQQPDIIKTNTSVYLYPSKNTKGDLIDNYQPDFLRFFPLLFCFFPLTYTQHSYLEASFFSQPMFIFPPTNHTHIESDFSPFLLCSASAFFFFPLSLYPHLPYFSSVWIYPVSQICITKAYHIRWAMAKVEFSLGGEGKGNKGRREMEWSKIAFSLSIKWGGRLGRFTC